MFYSSINLPSAWCSCGVSSPVFEGKQLLILIPPPLLPHGILSNQRPFKKLWLAGSRAAWVAGWLAGSKWEDGPRSPNQLTDIHKTWKKECHLFEKKKKDVVHTNAFLESLDAWKSVVFLLHIQFITIWKKQSNSQNKRCWSCTMHCVASVISGC